MTEQSSLCIFDFIGSMGSRMVQAGIQQLPLSQTNCFSYLNGQGCGCTCAKHI